jgi:WhiB family redox-sensing transcriptional regulator
MQDESWRDNAACKGVDVEVFFLSRDEPSKAAERMKAARAYCDVCVVQQRCLNYAINNSIRDGIYGGMTPKQRWSLKREKKVSK